AGIGRPTVRARLGRSLTAASRPVTVPETDGNLLRTVCRGRFALVVPRSEQGRASWRLGGHRGTPPAAALGGGPGGRGGGAPGGGGATGPAQRRIFRRPAALERSRVDRRRQYASGRGKGLGQLPECRGRADRGRVSRTGLRGWRGLQMAGGRGVGRGP